MQSAKKTSQVMKASPPQEIAPRFWATLSSLGRDSSSNSLVKILTKKGQAVWFDASFLESILSQMLRAPAVIWTISLTVDFVAVCTPSLRFQPFDTLGGTQVRI